MTPTEKARAIIGHEAHCPKSASFVLNARAPLEREAESPCTCPEPPLAVLIAAEEGTLHLKPKPQTEQSAAAGYCKRCDRITAPGPVCYRLPDPVMLWDLQGACTHASLFGLRYLPDGPSPSWPHRFLILDEDSKVFAGDGETREDALMRLWLSLKQAGLIPAPPVAKVRP